MISISTKISPASPQWTNSRAPDTQDLICAISRALYAEIQHFYQNIINNTGVIGFENIAESEYFSFEENLQNCNNDKISRSVNAEEISEFLQVLDGEFKFGTESFVLTMVYIRKFLVHSKLPLMCSNWKNILLISALLAQRVSNNTLISASDCKNIPGFWLDDIRLMEIDFLNLIDYNYKIETSEYLNQINSIQDILKNLKGGSWHLDNEKLENIINRSKRLSEEESGNDCGIYHSQAMYSIDLDEIDY